MLRDRHLKSRVGGHLSKGPRVHHQGGRTPSRAKCPLRGWVGTVILSVSGSTEWFLMATHYPDTEPTSPLSTAKICLDHYQDIYSTLYS